MKQKKLVLQPGGYYREEAVDMGKSRARPGHGVGPGNSARLNGALIGPARRKRPML